MFNRGNKTSTGIYDLQKKYKNTIPLQQLSFYDLAILWFNLALSQGFNFI